MIDFLHSSLFSAHSSFQQLEANILQDLTAALEVVRFEKGHVLMHENDLGDELFILQEGALGVTRQDANGTTLHLETLNLPGRFVGEIALITGLPRTSTVTVLEPSTLWRFSKASFDRLIEEHPSLLQSFTVFLASRLQRSQLSGILRNLFGDLDLIALKAIEAQLEWLSLTKGDRLFEEGDPGEAMYIVVSGRLRAVTKMPDGTEEYVGEMDSGEIVGEYALLTEEDRSATVYAVRDTNLAKLTATVFMELLEQYPQAVMQIMRIIIKRSQAQTRGVKHSASDRALSFALVPTAGVTPSVLNDIAHKLTSILSHFGSILLLDSKKIDEELGKTNAAQTDLSDITSITLTEWLNRQERNYQYIIYRIDPEWTTWTRRCLRFADRILLVGQPGNQPQPTRLEKQLTQYVQQAHMELMLFHDDTTNLPSGTAAWLQNRTLFTHHHVRMNNEKDWQRLGRRLVGKAIGLVFGGGGVRSYSQFGTILALEEAGIPVDIIGGVSMGSIIAGTYALEWSSERKQQVFPAFSSRKKLMTFTPPFASLFSSKKLATLFKNQTKGVDVEDAWRPLFCISTNTTKATPIIHQTGPIWRVLLASAAVPAVFLPVVHEGDLLVDGGVMNNLPIDVMIDHMGAGFVIAVNNPDSDQNNVYDFEPDLSGWEILWRRLNPFVPAIKVPGLVGHLMRCLSVNFMYHRQSVIDRADILISPPVSQFETLDFTALDAVSQIGYEATKQQLHAWLDAGGEFPPDALF